MLFEHAHRGQSRSVLLALLAILVCLIIPPGKLMAETLQLVQTPGFPEAIQIAMQQVKAGETGRLTIDLELPEGYHLHPRASLTYRVHVKGTGIDIAATDRQFNALGPSLPLAIPFQAAAGTHQATVDIDVTFIFCREDNTGVCAIQSVRWLVPLHTAPNGAAEDPVVSYKAEAPVVQKPL